jgi:hypothetical protein
MQQFVANDLLWERKWQEPQIPPRLKFIGDFHPKDTGKQFNMDVLLEVISNHKNIDGVTYNLILQGDGNPIILHKLSTEPCLFFNFPPGTKISYQHYGFGDYEKESWMINSHDITMENPIPQVLSIRTTVILPPGTHKISVIVPSHMAIIGELIQRRYKVHWPYFAMNAYHRGNHSKL